VEKFIDSQSIFDRKGLALLGIETTFKNSKDFILEGDRVERLINLLKQSVLLHTSVALQQKNT
jgi:hypothetical protein